MGQPPAREAWSTIQAMAYSDVQVFSHGDIGAFLAVLPVPLVAGQPARGVFGRSANCGAVPVRALSFRCFILKPNTKLNI